MVITAALCYRARTNSNSCQRTGHQMLGEILARWDKLQPCSSFTGACRTSDRERTGVTGFSPPWLTRKSMYDRGANCSVRVSGVSIFRPKAVRRGCSNPRWTSRRLKVSPCRAGPTSCFGHRGSSLVPSPLPYSRMDLHFTSVRPTHSAG
jgi:hypothetical protein